MPVFALKIVCDRPPIPEDDLFAAPEPEPEALPAGKYIGELIGARPFVTQQTRGVIAVVRIARPAQWRGWETHLRFIQAGPKRLAGRIARDGAALVSWQEVAGVKQPSRKDFSAALGIGQADRAQQVVVTIL